MNQKRILCLFSLILLFIVTQWIVWDNSTLETTSYTVKSKKLPSAFSGFRIAQISDLHNAEIGKGNTKLLKALQSEKPDIIVITGDFIDSRSTDPEVAVNFAKEAMKIAPCYYIPGNHEARVGEYITLKENLLKLGVIVLEDEKVSLECEDHHITILSLSDPGFWSPDQFVDRSATVKEKIADLKAEEDGFCLLLSHRPEHFEDYVQCGIDLALTGHAHGGQFRIPLIGGFFAPNQGFFPKYDAGLFSKNETNMVVSRGLGNSIFPFRINNRPELVIVTLETD